MSGKKKQALFLRNNTQKSHVIFGAFVIFCRELKKAPTDA